MYFMKTNPPTFLDEQAQARIDRAVEESRVKTRAQIVPVVVRCSGRYDRAEDVAGLLIGLLVAVLVFVWTPDATAGSGSWAGLTPMTKFGYAMLGLVCGFVGGAMLATHVWTLRRLFTSKREMKQEVNAAARVAFHDLATRFSDDDAGLLIFVSWYERRAVLLADDTVLGAIGQPTLNRLCQYLTDALETSDPTDAVVQVMTRASDELAAVLPPTTDDAKEVDVDEDAADEKGSTPDGDPQAS